VGPQDTGKENRDRAVERWNIPQRDPFKLTDCVENTHSSSTFQDEERLLEMTDWVGGNMYHAFVRKKDEALFSAVSKGN
jgi:hypothetical protein